MKPFKSADVVIIGGGCMGTACALFLAKRGLHVILCEMRNLGQGATGRNGGMVCELYGRMAMIGLVQPRKALAEENRRLYIELQNECEVDYHYQITGCLDIAATEEEYEEIKLTVDLQHFQDDDGVQFLDRQQIREIIPAINADMTFGARYRPNDGTIDSYKLSYAFARHAMGNGAEILMHTKVTEILKENDRVKGVMTDKGYIAAKYVVNCMNAWSNQLSEECRDVMPTRSIVCVTEPLSLPKPTPTFEFPFNGDYAYANFCNSGGNVVMGGSGFPLGHQGYFNERMRISEVGRLANHVANIFPILRDAKIIRAWAGTIALAPDGIELIGPSHITEGMYIASGFGAGMSQAAAVGQSIAQFICNEPQAVDMEIFKVGRFLPEGTSWTEPHDLGVLLGDVLEVEKESTEALIRRMQEKG